MGKKNRHSKDRLYITTTEWSTEYGGKKHVGSNQGSKPLPFDHCALSLGIFETPCCTPDGVVFDLVNLVPYVRKHKCNPITGETMTSQEIIRLNMVKNAEGKWHCPVTCKVFNNNTHIVAIKTTGNVFCYDAVNELNIKQSNYVDLLTNEKFSKSDIITLQDPNNTEHCSKRDINNFVHLKKVREDYMESQEAQDNKIRPNSVSQKVMKEIEMRKETDVAERERKRRLEQITEESEYIDDVLELLNLKAPTNAVNPGQVSTTGMASSSFTATTMARDTSSAIRLATPNELREARWRKLREVDKKAYVQLQTTVGNLNLEIFCNWAQRTSWNFLTLCKQGYYDNIPFHRLVPGFMIQTGDPTGTGKGGESAFGGKPFKDEFDSRLIHNDRGIVSMANSGSNTNKSQFFITLAKTSHLDYKHTVFGKVVGGLVVLDRMEAIGADKKEKPLESITLLKTIVFSDPLEEAEQLLIADIKKNMAELKQNELSSALPSNYTKAISSSSSSSSSSSNNNKRVVTSNISNTTNKVSTGMTTTLNSTSNNLIKPKQSLVEISTATSTAAATSSSNSKLSTVANNGKMADKDVDAFLKSQNQRLSTVSSTSLSSSSMPVYKKANTSGFGSFSGW